MHVGVALTVGSETQLQYVQPPVIPGHEFIGEVVKLSQVRVRVGGIYCACLIWSGGMHCVW